MPDFTIEKALGLPPGAAIAGIDEAGRGCLAGPVTAACVALPVGRLPEALIAGIDDSKRLSRPRRAELAIALRESAPFGIGWASSGEIDTINILEAAMLAMRRSAEDLARRLGRWPDHVLIDGNRLPDLQCPASTVIGGDRLSLSVAAASILAKTSRDHHMERLARDHPGYGWDRNAGYGTAEHRDALVRLGVTPEHRTSFSPVRRLLRG